eukprot:6473768-Amphidinium_carterae.1
MSTNNPEDGDAQHMQIRRSLKKATNNLWTSFLYNKCQLVRKPLGSTAKRKATRCGIVGLIRLRTGATTQAPSCGRVCAG